VGIAGRAYRGMTCDPLQRRTEVGDEPSATASPPSFR
jgi:hypothetical protein